MADHVKRTTTPPVDPAVRTPTSTDRDVLPPSDTVPARDTRDTLDPHDPLDAREARGTRESTGTRVVRDPDDGEPVIKDEKQLEKDAEDYEPARHGDVLGLTDADPNVEIPRATNDRGGNPKGIEVGSPATGVEEWGNTERGAVGVDLGGAGSPKRP